MVKVTFYSPGTLFPEQSVRELPNKDIELAKEEAKAILERYNAIPYCFVFEGEKERYFLNGKLRSKQEVIDEDRPDEEILRSNMINNDIEYVLENNNSWKVTCVFYPETDTVLEWEIPQR